MPYYVLYLKDTDKDGDLEVHESNCSIIKYKTPFKELGWHKDGQSAVITAKLLYPYKNINGCKFCSPACNTG